MFDDRVGAIVDTWIIKTSDRNKMLFAAAAVIVTGATTAIIYTSIRRKQKRKKEISPPAKANADPRQVSMRSLSQMSRASIQEVELKAMRAAKEVERMSALSEIATEVRNKK